MRQRHVARKEHGERHREVMHTEKEIEEKNDTACELKDRALLASVTGHISSAEFRISYTSRRGYEFHSPTAPVNTNSWDT